MSFICMNFLLHHFPHTQNGLIRCLDHSLSNIICSHKLLIENTSHTSSRYVMIERGKLFIIFKSCKYIYIIILYLIWLLLFKVIMTC